MENKTRGIIYGLLTGILWGIPFVAPKIIDGISPLQLACGRFFFFALVGLLQLQGVMAFWKTLTTKDKWLSLAFSASGFWLYTLLFFVGIKLASPLWASLIVGMLPLTISLTTQKKYSLAFVTSALFMLLGPVLLTLNSMQVFHESFSHSDYWGFGLLALVSCLILWTWFAVTNTRFLQRYPKTHAHHNSSLMALIAMPILFLCLFCDYLFTKQVTLISAKQFWPFIILSATLGLGSSWLASVLWNRCCQLVPKSLTGPLVMSEVFFGLVYGVILSKRIPHLLEFAAMLCFFIGLFFSLRALEEKPASS